MSNTSTSSETTVEKVAEKAIAGTATFDQLIKKPRRTLSFTVTTLDEDGEEQLLKMKYRALPSKEYDDLISEHPPTTKEKQAGAVYNVDTFAPALISAVSVEPRLSVEQATELYKSPQWSGGEIATLFFNAQRVCNAGLDVPFNARD
jgi:hypothetical protein